MAHEWTLVCAVFAFTLAISTSATATPPPRYDVDGCQPDKLTVYKVVVHTYWTRDKFPKHYPDWKPPAQWSKIYGLTHDARYVLFRLGQRVSNGVRAFAETGLADGLGAGGAGLGGALDEFSAPPIIQGAGRTETNFFVDGNHSRVSLMSRMMPSPDWFIGVDSFDLCVDGNWLDSITIEADPIDAGTDNGFTFTAPDWVTAPQGVAYRITSRYPAHPAGSFFYPHLRRLPPIATFQFIKLREYEVSEVFSHNEDDRRYDVLQLQNLAHNSIDVLDGNHALSVAEEAERAQIMPDLKFETAQAPQRAHLMSILGVLGAAGDDRATPDNAYHAVDMSNLPNSTWWKSRSRVMSTMSTMSAKSTTSSTPQPRSDNEVAAGDTRAILHGIARRYRRRQLARVQTNSNQLTDRKKIKKRRQSECVVSAWGPWSPCSGGCSGEGGVGESRRERRVVRRGRGRRGRRCPALTQTRWCATHTTNCTATALDADTFNDVVQRW